MEDPKIMKYFKEVETSNSMNDSNIQKKVNKDPASTIEIDSDLKIEKGALLIVEIGNKLCCPFPIIAKALLLYHRFMKVCPENKRKPDCIAAGVLSISIKLCDHDIKLKKIILEFYYSQNKKKFQEPATINQPSYKRLKKMNHNLVLIQYYIYNALSYNLECEIAHEIVLPYLAQLQATSDVDKSTVAYLCCTTMKLLSTFYFCRKCIQYTAKEIAMACLHFTFVSSGSEVHSFKAILKREIAAVEDLGKLNDIVDNMILVSDVSTLSIT
ncbi:hypothetical protein CEXT_6191 [Caerostris extrusa]|uniref:Cyclin N-terminal domain-containing protein n=1 Tax=Caerostris extrusa TaxID=172846 RepID=A0AAV4VCN7_CAEEX|nr:hypothetical protein CEXT_6191 [Caerostris extrusa]